MHQVDLKDIFTQLQHRHGFRNAATLFDLKTASVRRQLAEGGKNKELIANLMMHVIIEY